MNKKQRKQLDELQNKLTAIHEQIVNMVDEEQAKMDNMPENFQFGEQYEQMELAVECLEEAITHLEDTIEALQNAIES